MSKVIFDIVHGFIEIDELALSIIDTPEFQRLKNIKQLGVVHYVFPSATHTRFEHSIGVYHLAGELLSNLVKNQPDIDITNRDIQLIKIAGLCHDLGHGPYSHLLDNHILNLNNSIYRIHENRSILILKYIIDKYNLGINTNEINFISKLINPKFEINDYNFNENREYLFEIINNERNGIDVDKFDYIKRDTLYCGLSYSMDCSRILKHVKIIDNKLCYLDKSFNYIKDMYEVREKLHTQIYKHKTCLGIELMVKKIIEKVKEFYYLDKIIENPELFCKLDDYIVDYIFNESIDRFDFRCKREILEAKKIILNIKNRKLYKNTQLDDSELKNKKVIIIKYYLGYKSNENPFSNIYFYNKRELNKKFIKSDNEFKNNYKEIILKFIEY